MIIFGKNALDSKIITTFADLKAQNLNKRT